MNSGLLKQKRSTRGPAGARDARTRARITLAGELVS